MVVVGGLVWVIAFDAAPGEVFFDQIILAQAIPTRTPYPTFTPALYASLGGVLAVQPTTTRTRVPTWTPFPTNTPWPTNTPTITPTPIPTDTPVPVRSRVVHTPTPTLTPLPDVDFLVSVRQLKPCENQGKHHIFVHVVDQNGDGIPGMQVKVAWVGGETAIKTGTKIEDPGLGDFAMFKGTYFVEMIGASSQVAGPITPNIPKDELCKENGNPVANSLFHYSFEVVFTKIR